MSRWSGAIIALAACGGSSSPAQEPLPPSKPADLAAMRALLERYAPEQYAIITTYEALPNSWQLDNGELSVSHAQTFADWFPDGAVAETVDQLDTAVHEMFHMYSGSMGFELLSKEGDYGEGVHAILVDDAPYLLRYTARFPSRDIAPTFPADARTHRFPVYLEGDSSTQSDGVFGLLDEWCAYYHGSHTTVDLWPWVRDEAPRHPEVISDYVASLHKIGQPYAEFKLYILHYLAHAREHAPEIYDALVEHETFRRAYVEIDAAYRALIDTAGALEPEVHAFARANGVEPGAYTAPEDGLAGVLAALETEPYVELHSTMTRSRASARSQPAEIPSSVRRAASTRAASSE